MTKPQLAAQVYTIRDFIKTADTFAESMQRVRAIGYDGVQLDLEHHPDVPAAAIKRACDDAGLTICISHFGYELFESELDAIIERQQIWQCSQTAIVAMPRSYHEDGADGYRRFAAEASAIGEKLAAAGTTLSYHNHSFEFVRFPHPTADNPNSSRTGLDIIYTESDPNYLQAEIDTYWVQHGGADPVAWIQRLPNRMPVVHLKDMVVAYPPHERLGIQWMAEVGEGNMNWDGILAACNEIGVEWYAVEQDICRRDPFESLAISYRNLVRMGLS